MYIFPNIFFVIHIHYLSYHCKYKKLIQKIKDRIVNKYILLGFTKD